MGIARRGAWLDDGLPGAPRRLRVSSVRELSDAQASFGDLDDWRDPDRLETLLELLRRCWRTGGYGDVFTYMLVAEGAVDLGVYPEVKLWDLAAAKVIVEEAGGSSPTSEASRGPMAAVGSRPTD